MTTSFWSAARRSTRNSAKPSARTRTAAAQRRTERYDHRQGLQRRGAADHRLRCVGARDHCTLPREPLGCADRALLACRTAQSTGKDSLCRSRADSRLPRQLPLDFRCLRRLRNGRHARQGAARGGRGAHSGRTLLRVLRDSCGVRCAGRGGAGDVLSDGFSAAPFRSPGAAGSWPRSPSGAVLKLLRQLPQARVFGAGTQASSARTGARNRYAHGTSVRVSRHRLRHPRLGAGDGGEPGSSMASLIVISWRDIPAQVIAKQGRETAKVQLSQRFQEAIDRAAMRAGKGSSDAYLADWQRSAPRACGDDLPAEAAAEAARLEARFTAEDLERLIRAKGLGPNSGSPAAGSG